MNIKLKPREILLHIKKVNMTQAPYAMAFSGYNIDRELLNRLFDAKCAEGQKTKKFRDVRGE